MKNIIKQYPKTFILSVFLLAIIIIAACTIKVDVPKPEIKIVVNVPDGGSLVKVVVEVSDGGSLVEIDNADIVLPGAGNNSTKPIDASAN